MLCYCHSNKEYEDCCQPIIIKKKNAHTPEELMRSRYTSFILKNFDHLLATHDPKTKNEFDLKANQTWANTVQFTKLEIIKSKEAENQGIVEFKAYYTDLKTKQNQVHHELSQFRKENGHWYFSSGTTP